MNEINTQKSDIANQLNAVSDIIKKYNSFLLIPHKNPDGDCIGSVSALAEAINAMGKEAKIAVPGKIPERLEFLWNDKYKYTGQQYDVCITVDVAALYMIDDLKEKLFDKSNLTVCIDHHTTNSGFADFNCIDGNAAAAGEIVYKLIHKHLNADCNAFCNECLYAAIVSDTGSFQYSNTTEETHLIAADLLKSGINSQRIMRLLFENKKIESLKFMSEIIQNMEFFFDGKLCITFIDKNSLNKYGLTFEAVDEYSSLPRSVKGVEVGVLLKIYSENEIKISLRSNEYADVSAIAAKLGGGGHIRAAGATVNMNLNDAKKRLTKLVGEVI